MKMERELTGMLLYEICKESSSRSIDGKLQYMDDRVAHLTNCPDSKRRSLSRSPRYFKSNFKKNWSVANFNEERFLKKYETWLSKSTKVPIYSAVTQGHPSKDLNESSERTNRRKTEELRKHSSSEVLTYAASMSHRGNTYAADLIKKITETPTNNIFIPERNALKKHTPAEALAIFVEAELTTSQYEVIQNFNKNVYPCYSLLTKAEKDCYPSEGSIIVTETTAEVKLQALLDHTSPRLCKYLDEMFKVLSLEEKHDLELHNYKVGMRRVPASSV